MSVGSKGLGPNESLDGASICDKLYEIYGSEDLSVSLGASFAIEHWANAGFWDHLVEGFDKLNRRPGPGITLHDGSTSHKAPLGFWKFHQALEAQHAEHTMAVHEAKLKSNPAPPPIRSFLAGRAIKICDLTDAASDPKVDVMS